MKKKILTGFGLLFLTFLCGSIIAALYITRTAQRMDKLIMLHQVEILREDLIIHIQQVQSQLYRSAIRNREDVDVLLAQVKEMDRLMDSCLGCHHSPQLTQGLRGMRDMANDYKAAISHLVTAPTGPARVSEFERRAQDLGQELITMTQGMAFTANVRLQQKTQESMIMIREVRNVLYITLLAGFFLAVFTVYFLAQNLDQRLQKLREATQRISNGDLQHHVDINDTPESEFKELGEAFNVMTRTLRLSQRQGALSAKLAAIGELATNIAYEINNPLSSVLGYTGLMLKADDIPADKKEQLKIIEREAVRAKEFLKNLLNLSRRKSPLLAKSDISGLLQDSLLPVQEQSKMINVEISVTCPDGLPPVAVDADAMKEVFVNLINNAFAAMPRGGILKIRCMQGRDFMGKEVVNVELSDTGTGIPEEHLDKIFDPFFTTRPDVEGAGLGLTISCMVVQNHGGRIEVESRIGEGSTFRIVLPVWESNGS